MAPKMKANPETVKLSLTLPADVVGNLKVHALATGVKPSHLVAELVTEHLREWEVIDLRKKPEAA